MEVADVEDREDDGAADAEDEHEQALAEEPFAHLGVGALEGGVEADAGSFGEERKKEVIGLAAFEHEVDAEKDGGEDVEEVAEPVGERGEEVGGRGGEGSLRLAGGRGKIDLLGEGEALEFRDQKREVRGEVGDELPEIADDGGKGDGEEEDERSDADSKQEDDGDDAGGAAAADLCVLNAQDERHKHDCKERADVDDLELFEQVPGEIQGEDHAEEEGDMAAGDVAARLGVFDENGLIGWQVVSFGVRMLSVGCRGDRRSSFPAFRL